MGQFNHISNKHCFLPKIILLICSIMNWFISMTYIRNKFVKSLNSISLFTKPWNYNNYRPYVTVIFLSKYGINISPTQNQEYLLVVIEKYIVTTIVLFYGN